MRVAREASKHVYSHDFQYDAQVGMALTLPCKIDDHGYPPPTVDDIGWTIDDDDIDQNRRIHFTRSGPVPSLPAAVYTPLRGTPGSLVAWWRSG